MLLAPEDEKVVVLYISPDFLRYWFWNSISQHKNLEIPLLGNGFSWEIEVGSTEVEVEEVAGGSLS